MTTPSSGKLKNLNVICAQQSCWWLSQHREYAAQWELLLKKQSKVKRLKVQEKALFNFNKQFRKEYVRSEYEDFYSQKKLNSMLLTLLSMILMN